MDRRIPTGIARSRERCICRVHYKVISGDFNPGRNASSSEESRGSYYHELEMPSGVTLPYQPDSALGS